MDVSRLKTALAGPRGVRDILRSRVQAGVRLRCAVESSGGMLLMGT